MLFLPVHEGRLMKRLGSAKILLLVAIVFLVLSIGLSVVSLFPGPPGNNQTVTIINDSFRLSQNEVYRQGLGAFHGGENITVMVDCRTVFMKNFSIVTSSNSSRYVNSSNLNIAYSFTAGTDYYEAIFYSNAPNASWVHFQVTVEKPQVLFPSSWLTASAKIMFLLSLASAMLIILKLAFPKLTEKLETNPYSSPINKTFRNRLLALLLLSLVLWLVLLAVNSNPLATFENWYTDHLRHAYVSSLFLKYGLSVFNQPLGTLASQDNSHFMFVTWPEMPHLYPLGSILVFLPFGALLQNGFDPVLVYKLEIALFLVFAHLCLYFFLRVFLKKNLHLFWKLVGLYIIYVTLVIYAADGMFDSVAFLFSLIAITMFLSERYDYFFLLMGVSVFLKYQAGIFLLPLIIVGLLKLLERNHPGSLLRNKAVIAGAVLVGISGFTAYLSAPFLMQTRPELIMNSINAFAPHSQITWTLQAFAVLLTLAATLVYAFYMLNKNSLLSLSSLFLLLPSFTLPYFQNWYLPFMFVYILIPQRKKEVEATMIWLIFMIAMLYFGGAAFNPLQILNYFGSQLKI
jgi:flagellar basal body-associated protein FliL